MTRKFLPAQKKNFWKKAIRMLQYGRLPKMLVSAPAQYIRGIQIKRDYSDFLWNGLKELLRQSLNGFSSLTEHEQNEKIMEYSDRGFEGVIAYIYEYFSEFKLLITRAPENYYQDFLEGLVELDTGCTKKFLIQAGSKALAEGRITDGFLHVVSSAFYSGIFEVVIHDMPMEEAKKYINELRSFYGNGWKEYYRK